MKKCSNVNKLKTFCSFILFILSHFFVHLFRSLSSIIFLKFFLIEYSCPLGFHTATRLTKSVKNFSIWVKKINKTKQIDPQILIQFWTMLTLTKTEYDFCCIIPTLRLQRHRFALFWRTKHFCYYLLSQNNEVVTSFIISRGPINTIHLQIENWNAVK